MGQFSEAEMEYLRRGRRLARLATVGGDGTPHVAPVGFSYNPSEDSIDVGGRDFARTKKFRDVQRSGRAAIVVDDVLPPWRPRGVEVRGRAEAIDAPEPLIRIHPERIVSWGLAGDAGAEAAADSAERTGNAVDRFEIAEVLQEIEIAIDQRDVDGFASHFSADADYHGPFGSHHGREAIGAMSRAHHASGSMVGKRRMTGPARIRVDGDSAEAFSHWWVAEIHDAPAVYSTGTYEDALRREHGRWLITTRTIVIDPSWHGDPPAGG